MVDLKIRNLKKTSNLARDGLVSLSLAHEGYRANKHM